MKKGAHVADIGDLLNQLVEAAVSGAIPAIRSAAHDIAQDLFRAPKLPKPKKPELPLVVETKETEKDVFEVKDGDHAESPDQP